ncbi:MAG: inositol monophosphatase family protein [Desulfobacterales bacterium]
MNLGLIKRVGIAAAFKGSGVLLAHYGKLSNVFKKGVIDLVTEADTGSESIIIETIRKEFNDHSILAEESGLSTGNADFQWIIDPLDGTTNFAHQLGLFSISIAFALKGETVFGLVFNPITREFFTAEKGEGALLNGRPISVSQTKTVSDSFLVTGFPYNLRDDFDPLIMRFSKCLKASQGVRRLGSAAIDLCFLACGRFDGFWEQNLKPWDTAAGELIAREAGATITDFSNTPFTIDKTEILASNGKIHKEMISLLKIEDTV